MSGHSKWSTIKRKKALTDNARGKVFSKLGKAISIAVKTGGGESTTTNYKLRMAIETARVANMPKVNIDRAISKGGSIGNLEELVYEGYGPENISIYIVAATENRNRTGQEIKGIFEKANGTMGGPGAVAFNFESRGQIMVKKKKNSDEQILKLIDIGVEDIEEGKSLECLVAPDSLHTTKSAIEELGYTVLSAELVQNPKTYITLSNDKSEKILNLLDILNDHDDVQKVFANLDISDALDKVAE